MSATEPPYNSHESNWTAPFPRAPQAEHADEPPFNSDEDTDWCWTDAYLDTAERQRSNEPPFNSAIDRAAEIMGALPMTKVWGTDLDGDPEYLWRYPTNEERAEALAAADPPLLVTDEIQAVLDAAVRALPSEGAHGRPMELEIATLAYLASRGPA